MKSQCVYISFIFYSIPKVSKSMGTHCSNIHFSPHFTYSILKYKYSEKSLQTSNTTIQIDVFGAAAASVIETT